MKHIIVILITSVFSVIACNDSNSKVRSYKIDNSQTLSVIREIEYIIDSLLKDAVLFLSNDKMEANYAVAWYGAHIFKDVGQIDAALNLLFKFKHDIHTWKTEDREDELTEDYYNHYIGLVNMLIDEIKDSSAL